VTRNQELAKSVDDDGDDDDESTTQD
jgi:hypothetical protein